MFSLGAVGTIGGLLFGYFNGRAERTEARALSRNSRLHAQRLDAYAELAAFLERERLYIARTEPVITFGEAMPPPPALSENDWLTMQGRVGVAGSEAVERAVKDAQAAAMKFIGAVSVYRSADRRGTPDLYSEGGLREQMDKARERATTAIDEAERAMRDELASL